MYFDTPRPLANSVPSALRNVLAVPSERDLLALRLLRELLECLAADELVIELHERAVAQVERREVVVLDVVRARSCRRATPSPRSCCRRATRGTASSSRPCTRRAAARESSRTPACSSDTRARRPCGCRSSSPASIERVAHGVAVVPTGPNSSQPGWPTMPWRSARTFLPAIVTVLMLKNLMSRHRLAR